MSRIQEIDQLIQQGRGKKVCETIQAAMDEGTTSWWPICGPRA